MLNFIVDTYGNMWVPPYGFERLRSVKDVLLRNAESRYLIVRIWSCSEKQAGGYSGSRSHRLQPTVVIGRKLYQEDVEINITVLYNLSWIWNWILLYIQIFMVGGIETAAYTILKVVRKLVCKWVNFRNKFLWNENKMLNFHL